MPGLQPERATRNDLAGNQDRNSANTMEDRMSMSHDEMIAVIQAHAAGKTIQHRRRGAQEWSDLHPMCFSASFEVYDYRIKPEPPKPKEWWLISHNDTEPCGLCGVFESADEATSHHATFSSLIRVREVLSTEEEEGQ